MRGTFFGLCILLITCSTGEGHLNCTNDDSSFNSWLCGLNDWMESMKEWKHRIEQYCSEEDLGTEWKELFSCSEPITVSCCDDTMEHCEAIYFNCTICYCTDGKYTNRYRYQQLWKKHQTDFQTALRLYDEKLQNCRKSSECEENVAVTAQPKNVATDGVTTKPINPAADGVTTKPTNAPTDGVTTKPTNPPTDGVTTKPTNPPTDGVTTKPTNAPTDGVTTKPTNPATDGETTSPTNAMVDRLTIAPTNATNQEMRTAENPCPVSYDNKCFFVDTKRAVNRAEGVAVCENLGGYLANIYSQAHMNDVMNYVREQILNGTPAMLFHVGLTFNPAIPSSDNQTNRLFFRDGSEAPDNLKWYPFYPFTEEENAHWTDVILYVNAVPETEYQYLFNYPPGTLRFVLCEAD